MNHQHELSRQVKAMLAAKYFNNSPDTREMDSGEILISADISVATEENNRVLELTMQFCCKNSGILSRSILKMNAPSHAYKRVTDLLARINSNNSISCFEFDYRDGEIAARNFLQCMDYIPSVESIYTMIFDVNSQFINHGDRLIEAIGVDADTFEKCDDSEALDALDEALKGNVDAQHLLLGIIAADPDSFYLRRLKEAANSGNGIAQTLLQKSMGGSQDTNMERDMGNRKDISEYGYHGNCTPRNNVWPELLAKDDLYVKTATAYAKYLNSGVQILNKNDLINSSQKLAAALNGDSQECFFIAENFGSDKWPENADPELAFYWSAYRQAQLSVFDDDYEVMNATAVFNTAYYLVLFGTEAQKISAVQAMDACAEMFCVRSEVWHWFIVQKYISLLAGVHPEKVFRKPQYDYSCAVNKGRAIELYKKLIDLMIDAGDTNANDCAEELEGILGIRYYESRKGRKVSGTSGGSTSSSKKSGGCYIATCVYGSYDCPQVWTLRRYRDYSLANHGLGRLFIRCYYSISPILVRMFGDYSSVRSFWKLFLDRIVDALNKKGYQDTPYED